MPSQRRHPTAWRAPRPGGGRGRPAGRGGVEGLEGPGGETAPGGRCGRARDGLSGRAGVRAARAMACGGCGLGSSCGHGPSTTCVPVGMLSVPVRQRCRRPRGGPPCQEPTPPAPPCVSARCARPPADWP
ncbi:hypothetical protein EBF04_04460 [Streptomyces sp. I6]|nr:hypothetical protein EBF04_04460 [Streptomyces sp. I6]